MATRRLVHAAAIAALAIVATPAGADPQPPIDVVFKIHIEPQSDGRGGPPLEQRRVAYRRRRDDVEAVRAIAEAHGARLSIHGNGEFWEFAREEGDAARVQGWLAAGHHVGVHMHAVYRRGPHDWPDLPANRRTDASALRSLWQDHTNELAALLPAHDAVAATPFNFDGSGFDAMMASFGFAILGGGRHEVAYDWIGHPPFHPWRPGAEDLQEDLSNRDFLIVFHTAQIGEADTHGPDPVFHDQRPEHLQVEFLQILAERERQARRGGVEKRWLYGFLTHDNKSGADARQQIETLLAFVDPYVRSGVARYATFDEVAASFRDWEARHPGVSSFDYQPGDPYPYSFPALAVELQATASRVVDMVGPLAAPASVAAWRLRRGARSGGTQEDLVLAWSTSAATTTLDASSVLGATARVIDPVTGSVTTVDARAIPVGPDPVLASR